MRQPSFQSYAKLAMRNTRFKKLAYNAGIFSKIVMKYAPQGIEIGIFTRKDVADLHKIIIPKELRGQGLGSQIMTDIVAVADKHMMRIVLDPSTDFGASSKSRLIRFYKNFGFVENKGRYKDFTISSEMYREPKKH